jgi:hypothetical protein
MRALVGCGERIGNLESLSLGEREGPAAKRWEGERFQPLRTKR